MDSITQIALGSAVSEAVMQNKVGRKATIWGAIIGTIPDLDVLIPMGDAVKDFTYHRAASHSLFFMLLVVPAILWIILTIHPNTKAHWKKWIILITLTLFTHSFLDSFNIYGTQLFLPFTNYPVGLGSIFVIDPLYTIPLLSGVASIFILKSSQTLAKNLNYFGIILSSLYLLWSVTIQSHVNSVAEESLKKQNFEVTKIISTPSPFNTILWRVIGMTENGYVEGFYSLFDDDSNISFSSHQSSKIELNRLDYSWSFRRLEWFSKGFYKIELKDNLVLVTDLRMGIEPIYFFTFVIGEYQKNEFIEVSTIKINPQNYDLQSNFKMLWKRIWDDDVKDI